MNPKPESFLENETHKNLWGREIQTDHLILVRRQDLILINRKEKENLPNSGLLSPSGPQSGNKRNERQVLVSCSRTNKAMEHERDGYTNCNWRA